MTDKPQPLRSALLDGPAGQNGKRIAHGFSRARVAFQMAFMPG